MEHIRVNLTNFVVIGLSAAIFLSAGWMVMLWLSSKKVPILSPVSSILVRVHTSTPAATQAA